MHALECVYNRSLKQLENLIIKILDKNNYYDDLDGMIWMDWMDLDEVLWMKSFE